MSLPITSAPTADLLQPTEPIDEFGSHIHEGPLYRVLMARGPVFLPTRHRQKLAKKHGAICYIEGHLNASTNKNVCYASAIVAATSTATTRAFAADYCRRISEKFGIANGGVQVGGTGYALVAYTEVPSFVAEPGFVSHPAFARIVMTDEGQWELGRVLAETICHAFPSGGLVVLSPGHAYRDGRSITAGDPGALVTREIDPPKAFDTEAELNEIYLDRCARVLIRKRAA